MRWTGLFFALGLFEVVTLVAMSADASAQLPFIAGSRSFSAENAPVNPPPANLTVNRTQIDPKSLQTDGSRKISRARLRNRCARITTTCWGAA